MDLLMSSLILLILFLSLLQSSVATGPANSSNLSVRYLFKDYPFSTTPILPLSGDDAELPSPNLTLQYVAIGLGTQNYTCSSPKSQPVQLGAVATLLDATSLAYTNESDLHLIPPIAVYFHPHLSRMALPRPYEEMLVMGHHFFDSAGTPSFHLSSVNKSFYGTKSGDIKAPATADKGPEGTGAVDWLRLTPKEGYDSVGLSLVYRVVTAGGEAPINCTAGGALTVQYAAEYWFY